MKVPSVPKEPRQKRNDAADAAVSSLKRADKTIVVGTALRVHIFCGDFKDGRMRRTTLSSLGFLRQTTAGLAVLTAGAVGPLHAQQTGSACKLLQVSEIEAAIGGKAEKAPSGEKQSIPGAMTLDQCEVVLKGSGQTHPVSIRVVTELPMSGADAINARNTGTAREQQWKVAGAKLEQSTVGSAICILAGRPNVASHTTCSIPRGKGYVEVEVVGDVGNLPSMQTVAALAQKAVSRL